MLARLVKGGVNVFRLNMSHATHDQVREMVDLIRKTCDELMTRASILMDTQGPEIRTGTLGEPLDLEQGERISLTVRGAASVEEKSVDVNYDQLVDDIRIGDVVMIDNGVIELKVLEKQNNQLVCEVMTPGTMGSRRHVNLPGVRVNLPALTAKDKKDVALGVEVGVDWFAMSFVREPADVCALKEILEAHGSNQKVMAKLEDQEGVKNLDGIIAVSDGVMVARGDLGIECPFEELPIIQRRIVQGCAKAGKPVVVATHMLESMISNPSPTRAEITDTANAIFEQADAIMLSGETSVGRYPLKCVELMDRIARRMEPEDGMDYHKDTHVNHIYAQLMRSAVVLAEACNADALFVFTQSGVIAKSAAAQRSMQAPIYAFSANEELLNQLPVYWGINPTFLEAGNDPEKNVSRAIDKLKSRGLLTEGQVVVAVTEVEINGKLVDTILTETV